MIWELDGVPLLVAEPFPANNRQKSTHWQGLHIFDWLYPSKSKKYAN